ncbi:predicted protein [Plenodomus lingam JN3]|uniref:Predicted protein n=2 Tax=Leptosphaeria maculans TaxID=5022 RepID=E5AC36_LEPMJ|nr:predicted protein [Plenodomus lingam JN3]CBY00147.1 predicted protein [Plenodomus lingam JN3]
MQDIGWTAADLQEKATLLCLRAYEFYALLSDLAPKSARLYALPQSWVLYGLVAPLKIEFPDDENVHFQERLDGAYWLQGPPQKHTSALRRRREALGARNALYETAVIGVCAKKGFLTLEHICVKALLSSKLALWPDGVHFPCRVGVELQRTENQHYSPDQFVQHNNHVLNGDPTMLRPRRYFPTASKLAFRSSHALTSTRL